MALREIIARFGFQFDQRGLKKAQGGIANVVGSLGKLGIALGAGVVARGIKNFVTDMVDAGDALGKSAKQLGISTTELQKWDVAARLSGASTQELQVGLRTLAKNSLLAEQGSKQAADGFKLLDVEVTKADGSLKDTNTLFRETGLALGQVENNTERTALAQQLLGRSGVKLLPLFEQGAEALDEMLGKLEEYGGGIGPEAVKLSEDAADQFLLFELATDSLKSKLAVAVLPVLNQLVGGLSKAISFISKAGISAETFKSVLIALGLVLGKLAIAKFGGSLLQLGRAALLPLAKFLLLFLIVDDLIALFEGRGSLIGTFIDKIFGKGSAKAVIDAIKGIGSAIGNLLATGDFEEFDKALDEIFGPIGHDIVADVVFTFEMIGEAIDAGLQSAADALNGFFQMLADWANGVLDAIADAAKSFGQAAADLGIAIIDGIAEAITDGADAVIDALGDVVDAAIKAVKKKLGIDSPSKVFAEIGGQNIEGLVAGMKDAARAGAVGASAATAAASGLSGPRSLSAPVRGGAGAPMGGVVFKSDIALSVSGGSASDPQIAKLRQGVRSELRDNRRATLDALNQVIEAPV